VYKYYTILYLKSTTPTNTCFRRSPSLRTEESRLLKSLLLLGGDKHWERSEAAVYDTEPQVLPRKGIQDVGQLDKGLPGYTRNYTHGFPSMGLPPAHQFYYTLTGEDIDRVESETVDIHKR